MLLVRITGWRPTPSATPPPSAHTRTASVLARSKVPRPTPALAWPPSAHVTRTVEVRPKIK
eukprot:9023387-Prorocentrum_lima.AAC.1